MECSSNSHVSRLGVSSAWAGYPGPVVVVVGVWGQVEGGGAEGPDTARGGRKVQ